MLSAQDIAQRLGLKRHPRSWRGRCPACDYANTFSVRADRAGRPRLFCAACQDRQALAEAVARSTGEPLSTEPANGPDQAANRHRKSEIALQTWRGSGCALGTPAERYLASRGLKDLAASPVLRFRADVCHPEGGRYAALVALVSDAADRPVAIHRTYLRRDGTGKANVQPTKASVGPVWGGAIRLHPLDDDRPLIIAEGIETAGAAARLMGSPVWAAISAGNLAKGLVLPPEARRVVIAADPDHAGRTAAREAWLRWRAEGRHVRIAMPDGRGDFNDLLQAKVAANA